MAEQWKKKGSYESTKKRFQEYEDVFKPARPKKENGDDENDLDRQNDEYEGKNEPQHIKDIFKK